MRRPADADAQFILFRLGRCTWLLTPSGSALIPSLPFKPRGQQRLRESAADHGICIHDRLYRCHDYLSSAVWSRLGAPIMRSCTWQASTALFSLPNVFSGSALKSSIQTYLLLAFIGAAGLSQIANHWVGGALQAWLTFLPSAAVFFFIVANVTTVRRLKIVALASVAACLGLVAEALCGYYAGFLGDTFVLKMHFESGQAVEQILRLRGVGFLNDPNDLAQMLIIALALLFVAWRQGRVISNSLFVLAPAAILLWAVYLTHSRGALIGLAVFVLMAGYKRFGKVPSLVLTAMLGVAMMALDFTGGRDISASAASTASRSGPRTRTVQKRAGIRSRIWKFRRF